MAKKTVVDAEGQQNRKRKSRNQTINVDYQGVPQDKEKIRRIKKPFKIIKTHPGTVPHAKPGLETFKGHQDTVYGNIIEDCHINYGDEEQGIEASDIPAAAPDTPFIHKRLRRETLLRKKKSFWLGGNLDAWGAVDSLQYKELRKFICAPIVSV
jgi:hypothetical protein